MQIALIFLRELSIVNIRGTFVEIRIIDLDILLYDAAVVKKKNLRIPHPEMPSRKFVLIPLSEIAPQVIHPELGITISELLINVKDEKRIHLYHA